MRGGYNSTPPVGPQSPQGWPNQPQPDYAQPAAPGYPPQGSGYPPQGQGYPPQGGYAPNPGYPPQGGYTQPQGYPPQGGYAQPQGYPPQGGYVPPYTPPQPQPQPQQSPQAAQATKSRLAAGLLGIFLGSLGVHNFYLGRVGKGIIQLILSLTVIGLPVSSLWAFIEGVIILCSSEGSPWHKDAKGYELRD